MGLFEKIFPKSDTKKELNRYFLTLGGYQPVFNSFAGGVYEAELCRAAVHTFATQISKLKPEIVGTAYSNLNHILQYQPNPWMDTTKFLYKLATILETENTAFIVPLYREDMQTVNGFYPIRPSMAEVREDKSGNPFLVFSFLNNGKKAALELENVGIMTKFFYKNDFFGEDNNALKPTMELINVQNTGIAEGVKQSASVRFIAKLANDDALTATIVGYDKVYQLDQALCNISGSGNWTVAEAVAAVIADSGVELAINIPSEIGQRTVGKAMPANTTHREALRLIAQAAMTHIFINRLDVLTAKDYDVDAAVDVLDGTNMTTWGEAKDTGRINTVTVTVDENIVYTTTNKTADEPLKVLAVTNPLVTLQEVANWILEMAGYRYEYSLKSMGNPAGDVGDCIEVANVYGSKEKAIAIRESYSYNGALRANIRAYGR